MKALENFCDIWIDLEKSYLKYKDKLNVNTKKDYLLKLIFNKNGEVILDSIKSLLLKEVDYYDTQELESYSTLIEFFDSLKLYIESVDINTLEVENLNYFMIEVGSCASNVLTEKQITKEELLESFTYEPNTKHMDSLNLFRFFGDIKSFSNYYNGAPKAVKFKESLKNPMFYVSLDTLDVFYDMIEKQKVGNLNNIFLSQNISFIGKLFTGGKFNTLVCSKELYSNGKILGRKVTKDGESDGVLVCNYNDSLLIVLV